jgi:hypothetical protein
MLFYPFALGIHVPCGLETPLNRHQYLLGSTLITQLHVRNALSTEKAGTERLAGVRDGLVVCF